MCRRSSSGVVCDFLDHSADPRLLFHLLHDGIMLSTALHYNGKMTLLSATFMHHSTYRLHIITTPLYLDLFLPGSAPHNAQMGTWICQLQSLRRSDLPVVSYPSDLPFQLKLCLTYPRSDFFFAVCLVQAFVSGRSGCSETLPLFPSPFYVLQKHSSTAASQHSSDDSTPPDQYTLQISPGLQVVSRFFTISIGAFTLSNLSLGCQRKRLS